MKYTREQIQNSINHWQAVLNESLFGSDFSKQDMKDSQESFLKFVQFLAQVNKKMRSKKVDVKIEVYIGERGPLKLKNIDVVNCGWFKKKSIIFNVESGGKLKEADGAGETPPETGASKTVPLNTFQGFINILHDKNVKKLTDEIGGVALNCDEADKDVIKKGFEIYKHVVSTVLEKCEATGNKIKMTFRQSKTDSDDDKLFSE